MRTTNKTTRDHTKNLSVFARYSTAFLAVKCKITSLVVSSKAGSSRHRQFVKTHTLMSVHHMTPKTSTVRYSKPVLPYKTECDGWRLVHRIYCSAHQNINKQCLWAFRNALFLGDFLVFFYICLTSWPETWSWKFIISFRMAKDTKKEAAGWLRTTKKRDCIWDTDRSKKSCNKHTINSTVQPHSHLFVFFFPFFSS